MSLLSTLQYRRRRLLWILVANCFILSTLSTQSSSTCTTATAAIFGIRGGGLFGFGKRSNKNGTGGDDDDDKPKRFPALTREEVEEKLNIPVFGITDQNGNGVILSDNQSGNNIFHFFFSKHMADAALRAVSAANMDAPELKVSAFHLGKCWFKLINCSGSKMFKLQKYGEGNGEEHTKPIHFRLVPNMKDLMGARVLTGFKEGDVKKLKEAVETPNAPQALSIIQKASTDATSFNSPFDQIPVFAIAQMRVRKKDEEGNPSGEPMLPMHLSTKTMSDTWNQFIEHSPQFTDAEATLQLVELHRLIDMMQKDSDFDFRNVVFVIPSYDQNDTSTNDESDDDDSDDDSGGGGDNGMKADNTPNYDDASIEPFVSFEMYADTPDQTLVQLSE
ncbi:hypothetical protein THAPSDRAFT_269135 [Thalassiosira pseudonana CCMP1335]|uniref:Uncharacterized protein n=1 Tax=Thalassiosira pseudonana TaxID=35128 RepID=B8C672_THAPS|nr:hypothetical protein THAPSDRAFT_269135 [Thalassiosira pseudonana CCMP1335]EED91245.1 hypothetical protein THAPSDRAFT_269135 [Thalassiosira pseudonana CCMP1335]